MKIITGDISYRYLALGTFAYTNVEPLKLSTKAFLGLVETIACRGKRRAQCREHGLLDDRNLFQVGFATSSL